MTADRRRVLAGLAAGLLFTGAGVARAQDDVLAAARKRGSLKVAVYRDFPPFYDDGKGISVDVAQRLAERLGLRLELLPFDADENVNDDLRNMVWRGHYLGYGPADVMLQVPVDRHVMDANPRVTIFAPYFRESVAIARDRSRIPELDSLAPFATHRVGVDNASVAALIVAGADGGRYRDNLAVFKSPREAIDALRAGRVPAVMALRSELEASLGKDPRFVISPLPVRQAGVPDGWVLGLASKKDATDLIKALQAAVNEMAASGELAQVFARHGVTLARP